MVCAVVWEYCKTNKPLCSWPKRWGIEELPQHWPSKHKRSCTSHVCLLPCDIIWYPPSHSVFCHTGLFLVRSVSLLGKYVPHLPPWSTSSLSSDVYLAVILLLKESLVSWLRLWISVLFPRPPCLMCIFSSVSHAVILFSFEFHLYVILKCNVYKSKVLTLSIHNYKEYNL